MSIFNRLTSVEKGFFQKLLKKENPQNAIVEITNLLADAEDDLQNVLSEDILKICEKFKIDLSKAFLSERISLFRQYLNFVLEDVNITNDELDTLAHLRSLLFLKERDVADIMDDECKLRYQWELNEVLSDNRIDEVEKEKLERLRQNLLLSTKDAKELLADAAQKIMEDKITEALKDQRLSPEEEKEIERIAINLGVKLDLDGEVKEALYRYRIYWQIENGILPNLDSDIRIQKNELLHFQGDVDWMEIRKQTKRYNYSGPTARIKIMKGVYWRLGSVAVQPISEDVLTKIDEGKIYLTNKRLIFLGSKGNKTIRLEKIIDFTPYSNGVQIEKDVGRSPFLKFQQNIDILSLLLNKLL